MECVIANLRHNQAKIISLEKAHEKSIVGQNMEMEQLKSSCAERLVSLEHRVSELSKTEAEQEVEMDFMQTSLVDLKRQRAEAVLL